jgi:tetratricopeptide (TPR) repeat protein
MSDEVRNMCQQAEQLINARHFNEAIALLNRAGTLEPSCAEVHGYLGMAYQNSLNTSQAIEEYRKALALNPQMSFIKVNLGTCYMNMNEPEQGVPYLQQYLQENPSAPDAAQVRNYIQQASSRQGQQNLRGLVEQGQALISQRRYNEACTAFEQATSQQPNFAPAHFYLGYALAQSGKSQQAISEFQNCLQLDPSVSEAVLNIGSNYQSLGDCGNAISWYERYLRENPNSPKAGDIKQRIMGLRQQLSQKTGAPARPQERTSAYQAQTIASYQTQPTAESVQDDYLANASSGGRYFRWPRLPIRVFIASGAGTPEYRDSYARALSEAFSMWTQGSENRIAFVLVPDPQQSDLFCDWTADPNKVIDGGAVEGGLTKLSGQPQPNGDVSIVSARITLLTNRSGIPLSNDDMKKVCLHEVGHALGINGHSSNNQDVMFFSESPTVWPSLTKRDRATICRLYSSYPRLGQ